MYRQFMCRIVVPLVDTPISPPSRTDGRRVTLCCSVVLLSLQLTTWNVGNGVNTLEWLPSMRGLGKISGAYTTGSGGRVPRQNCHHWRVTHDDRDKEETVSGRDVCSDISINARGSVGNVYSNAYNFYKTIPGTISLD